MENKKINILNVLFDNLKQKEMVALLMKRVNNKQKTFIVTANPEIVMYANHHQSYRQLLKQATVITADGIGIIKGSKILGTPIVERVTGYDLMLDLFKEANRLNKRVYLLGARQEVIALAEQKLKQDYPGIVLVGVHNGYFDLADEEVLHDVLDSKADMVFVGLGFPRQEKWILQYLEKADSGLVMGIGGAFDAYTGVVKRAPALFIKMNLEWFYRLIKQPSRFRRMLVLPKFLVAVYQEKNHRSK
ncbi:WecB/TagA/CpsF family glycosyltransferase [Carnobacterium sp. TMP28]|uniref:WecB/TagA/CpsF family glycosyltransferase n=1 Tax=Carnobacterium sp. TMP28 TaxID=3397060 RepID=UPI0039E0B724